MEHTQLILNFDNSFCIDIYNDRLFNDNFAVEMLETIAFIEKGLQDVSNPSEIIPTLRNHPFHVSKCSNCGQMFASNRDNDVQMTCQACKMEMTPEIINSSAAQTLISRFQHLKGDKISQLSDGTGLMIIILKNKNARTSKIVMNLLKHYNFTVSKSEGKNFESLMKIAAANMTVNKNTYKNVIYATTPLTDKDIKFNGIVPRMEECDRAIRKAIPYTNTFSVDM